MRIKVGHDVMAIKNEAPGRKTRSFNRILTQVGLVTLGAACTIIAITQGLITADYLLAMAR